MIPSLNTTNPSKNAGPETDVCLSLSSPAYAMPTDQLLSACEVNAEKGLSDAQVQSRGQQCGANQLTEAPPVPARRKFMAQFTDLVIWILIVAAIISGLMKEWVDTAAILAIVIVNGMIGYLQEEKAGRATGGSGRQDFRLCPRLRRT
ncbi:MAG: cation-transporting P-type ATPase [Planctomycetaceae bacterium]